MRTPATQTLLRDLAATDDWRRLARCSQESAEDFFPVGEGPAARTQAQRAKRICQRCEVREECLEWALDSQIRHGVFGGLDETERLRMLRARE